MAYDLMLIVHVVTSTMWVGGVFMAAFIDWPTAKSTIKDGKFPFEFVLSHGKKIFFWVYFAMAGLTLSGVSLLLSRPVADDQMIYVMAKFAALILMAGFTLYGTFITWPKLQVAINRDAQHIYQVYIYRAHATFFFGILAIIMGLVM